MPLPTSPDPPVTMTTVISDAIVQGQRRAFYPPGTTRFRKPDPSARARRRHQEVSDSAIEVQS
eukprot:4632007-Pleurochrysis_carterae.AAC.1